MGPFYCRRQQDHLDTSFFREIRRFPGATQIERYKFAQAYVIAHEIGHP